MGNGDFASVKTGISLLSLPHKFGSHRFVARRLTLGLHDEIDFSLSDPGGVSVIFLKENHLDAAVIRKELDGDPILPETRFGSGTENSDRLHIENDAVFLLKVAAPSQRQR